ncbi:carbon catabolite repressor protein [Achlya hypogyna]|uniref:Carbon catabolite repressor protein n=1 Tax=Achlya hypogyna TaxID=1202772 RepID=A0A1V9YAY5_ACHHY|nr:carbon catabolite repressor protein [Achlya hypogyna]
MKGRGYHLSQSPPRGSPTSGEGRISLRVDQPVEGCEVTTHAFYRSSEGDIDDDDFHLKFFWYKSSTTRACANKQCPRVGTGEGNIVMLMAKIECAVCSRMGIANESSGFCTPECFRSGWGNHRQLHDHAAKHPNNQKNRNATDVSAAKEKAHSLDLLNAAMVPVKDESWIALQASKTYIPTSADVGHVLRVECTAMLRSGEECGPPKFTETNIVLPFPPLAPKRPMISSIKDTARVRYIGSFRVLSYNVLAEIYATRQMYPYCPMWALNWSFRKQLLKRELQLYNADILCLQEVQADHYKSFFLPMMTDLGYDGLYLQKTRESMGLVGKVDGCAMFYRKNRFYLKEQYSLEFNEAANDFVASLLASFDMAYPAASHHERDAYQASLARVRQRLVRDNVAQIVVLDVLPEPASGLARKPVLPSICVTNVHIFSNPEFPDVKLWQTNTLLQQMEQIANSRRLPIIVCGDFNSEPPSAVYELLSQNHVGSDHPELKTLADVVPMTKFAHAMPFASAYASVFGTEPDYTNYTGSWVGVVDYIWFTSDKLTPVAALQVHPPEVLKAYARTCLPNCQFVSDHVPVVVDFCLKTPLPGRMSRRSTRRGVGAETDRATEAALEAALCAALAPVYVHVDNVSLRELQRHVLGPQRYWYQSVKLEAVSDFAAKKWTVRLYHAQWRRSLAEWYANPASVVGAPRRAEAAATLVGTFEHERQARQALERAVRQRDRSNPVASDSAAPAPPPWNRHFSAVVVATAFERLPLADRLERVYAALLVSEPAAAFASLTKVSYIGDHVRRLPCFQQLPLHVTAVCRTPAQHDAALATAALTERLGLGHGTITSIGVDTRARSTAADLRALVDGVPAATRVPHFYHGLPPELKQLLAQEQDALYRAAHALGRDADVHSVCQRVAKRQRALAVAATKLQRLFRRGLQARVLRRLLRRHRHAITLQRVYRGYRARVFATELFLVSTFAVTHIQAAFRACVSRRATAALRARMSAGALAMQRLFRGHRARRWAFWLRYHVASAVQIQRVVRGHLGRLRAHMFRHAQYKRRVVVPATQLLQRVYRGHRGRCAFRRRKAAYVEAKVLTPAAIAIQRVVRGGQGRARVRRLQLERVAAAALQRAFRAYRSRVQWAATFARRRRNLMASRIGAAGRGFLARRVLARARRKVHLQSVVLPAARLVQRLFRGYMVRKRLEELRDKHEAANVIQFAWREAKRTAAERAAWESRVAGLQTAAAVVLQCLFRRFLARKTVAARRLAQRGRYGAAALKVQAAWRSYASRTHFKDMRELLKIEVQARALTTLKDELEMVAFDTEDARADLARIVKYKKKALQHIHDLKQMRLDWELRVPFVEKELAEMTPEDAARGWAEAFETEKVVLHFSRLLSAEEILSKREQIREYDAEIATLHMELEDLERDHEEFRVAETLQLETVRRLELARSGMHFAAATARAVRLQRVRWQVRSVRRHVLLRRQNAALAAQLPAPQGGVAFAAAHARQRSAVRALQATAQAEDKRRAAAREAAGSRNPHVLATYDAVVAATRALVDEASLAMRLPKRDVREEGMCWECGHVVCTCHVAAVAVAAPSAKAAKAKKLPPQKLGRRRKGYHDASIPRVDPNQH